MSTPTATATQIAPAPRTNTLAILSLVFAFIFWPVGIVCGHLARRQIKTTGEGGEGLAVAGLILSYLALAATTVVLAFGVAVAASVANHTSEPIVPNIGTPAATLYGGTATPGFTDGTYVIGTDMPAGTYRTAGPANGLGACVWQRLANTSGEFTASIAQNVTSGPDVVTVASTDKAFTTTGCQAWSKVS